MLLHIHIAIYHPCTNHIQYRYSIRANCPS